MSQPVGASPARAGSRPRALNTAIFFTTPPPFPFRALRSARPTSSRLIASTSTRSVWVERVRENAGYRHKVDVPLRIARGVPQVRRETVHALGRRSLLRQRGLHLPGNVLGKAIQASLGQPEMTSQPARRGDAALPARRASTLGKMRRVDARREVCVSSRARLLQNWSRVVFAASVSGSTCITASVKAAGDSTCDGPALAAIGAPSESRQREKRGTCWGRTAATWEGSHRVREIIIARHYPPITRSITRSLFTNYPPLLL